MRNMQSLEAAHDMHAMYTYVSMRTLQLQSRECSTCVYMSCKLVSKCSILRIANLPLSLQFRLGMSPSHIAQSLAANSLKSLLRLQYSCVCAHGCVCWNRWTHWHLPRNSAPRRWESNGQMFCCFLSGFAIDLTYISPYDNARITIRPYLGLALLLVYLWWHVDSRPLCGYMDSHAWA